MPRIRATDDNVNIINYVRAIFKAQGRDMTKCEMCGVKLHTEKPIIHHGKYEGATLKDLQIVCQKCNLQPENVKLK